jgi:holo-[acyl-carrier protein] synthase
MEGLYMAGYPPFIKGVGVDIIEVDRIERAVSRRKNFLNRFFNPCEIKKRPSDKTYYQHIAARFAAKEAVAKALGKGFRGFKWKDIIILQDPMGKPFVELAGMAHQKALALGIGDFLLSTAHTREYAVANAIAISKTKGDESL